MPVKSKCLKISSQTSIIYVDQYFFYATQHYYYAGITQYQQIMICEEYLFYPYVLSKVYEKLVLRQMAEFIDSKHLLPSHMSGFRKGNSTTTALINIRDDIIKAMNRGEVTIMVFADFSKAFDTVHFDIIIRKLHLMGFSTQFLRWMMSYLTERQQYVQIDDKKSGKLYTNFGVPQGSILGPVLFNLYVADLADELGTVCNCHQYADDTTIYNSVKPKDFQLGVEQMNNSLTNLTRWSDESINLL